MKRAALNATRHAFTILELLVVLTIIIVLAGLILATSGYVQNKGARSRTGVEIAAISAALENYKADHGMYPSNDDTKALDPATTNPSDYRSASSYLYSQVTGDDDANPITPAPISTRNYFGGALRPSMLAPNPPGPSTYLQDPFRNSYGYSTAKSEDSAGAVGYNPSFDLWSTANSANPVQWIKNW